MNTLARLLLLLALLAPATIGRAEERRPLRARWDMPPQCTPLAPARIKDLKQELHETGYRLVIALHKAQAPSDKAEPPPRDLYLVNADGTGLRQLTDTPDREEHVPRVSPDGKMFTYNYGDYLVDVKTFKTRPLNGAYVWTPDSRQTAECDKNGIVYIDVATGKRTKPVRVERRVSIVDLTQDGRWFIFEIRDYLGTKYTIDYMSSAGGAIHKMPNHPIQGGECHPAFSPDGKWMCWNSGQSLSVRKFDPALPGGTDGKITTLPAPSIGQDPCGRWSHCGRYIAFVKIPHAGNWKVHSPICIARVVDGATVTISPPGWVGHHWDYDWLPPEETP